MAHFLVYHVRDVKFVAAFDVDAKKVGFDLSEAIFSSENNTIKIADVPTTGITVQRGGTIIDLTAREWAVFEAFVQRPNALLSKSQLEERLYAFGAEIESNTIEVYISRLRKKLGRELIETVRGMGYRLMPV